MLLEQFVSYNGFSLLNELDDDLMLELDQVVRQNQLACFPYSKSRKAEEELFATYPELSAVIEHNRRTTIDSMVLHCKPHDDATRHDGLLRPGDISINKSSPNSPASRPHQSVNEEQMTRVKDSLLKAKASAGNLMFEMDEVLDVRDKFGEAESAFTGRLERPSGIEQQGLPLDVSKNSACSAPGDGDLLVERRFEPAVSENPSLPTEKYQSTTVDGEISERQLLSSSDKTPWNYPTGSSKSDMKAIMAQASSDRHSNILSGLSPHAQKAAASGASPAKLSQRERKKRQQQQLSEMQQSTPDSVPVVAATPVEVSPPISPWQVASRATKVSLEEVLKADSGNVSPSNRRKSSRVASNPSLTLRQTVSGSVPVAQRAASAGDGLQGSLPARSNSSSNSLPLTHPRPPLGSHALHSDSTAPSLLLPASSTPIESIRHQPPVVEPSLQLSMADILALQQTEKDIIKEAAAKRSLQEIQEEQAFQEWWDQESRKVMEKEEKAGQNTEEGGEGSSRGKGRDRGRGRGRGREGKSGARGGRGGDSRGGRGVRDGRGGRGDGGDLEEGRGGSNGGSGSRSRGRGRGRRPADQPGVG